MSEHARIEVAADEPQHALVRDPSFQPSHQHVVADPVEGRGATLPITEMFRPR
jgi:hypothetical protein